MAKSERYNPYQLSFDFAARPLDLGQHVRLIKEPYTIRQPADAAFYLTTNVFTPFDHFKQEQLYILLLDQKHKITHDVLVYKGTVNALNVRIAELFMEAIKVNAPKIVLSHCHPSGDARPSPEDIQVTEQVYAAGQLLSIDVIDHIIIGRQVWYSLREKGLGFPLASA